MLTPNADRKNKRCSVCYKYFTPSGNCQKRCSRCRLLPRFRRFSEYYTKRKSGVGSGGNQWEGNNSQYKDGSSGYRKHIKDECEDCGGVRHLNVHHKNHNRKDGRKKNLKTLCKRCHQILHGCADNLPKGKDLSILKKKQAKAAKRDCNGRFII